MREKAPGEQAARRIFRSGGGRGVQRLSKAAASKTAGVAPLILDTAKMTKGVGAVEETLKWGQPSYLTTATKSGSTIRINRIKSPARPLRGVSIARPTSRDFSPAVPDGIDYGGNRSILLDAGRCCTESRVAALRGAGADVSFEEGRAGREDRFSSRLEGARPHKTGRSGKSTSLRAEAKQSSFCATTAGKLDCLVKSAPAQ